MASPQPNPVDGGTVEGYGSAVPDGPSVQAVAEIPRPTRRQQARLMRRLLQTPESALAEIAERYGPICTLGGGPFRLVVIGSPSLIHALLMQPNDRYHWGSRISPFRFVVGPTSLLVSDGPDHRRRRGAVQHAFSRRRLNRWIPMIVDRTDAAVDQLLATVPASGPRRPVPDSVVAS